MLKNANTVSFIATANAEKSRHFYTEILGLSLIEETPFAIVVESKNTIIRIQKTQQVHTPPYTSLGWEVSEIDATVSALTDAGVSFELFDGLEQNELGIWATPDGAKIAWFKDPDANLLSLTQHAKN